MDSIAVWAANLATADGPRKAVSATTQRDSANARRASPVADAISAFRDTGITARMDVHVSYFSCRCLINHDALFNLQKDLSI